MWVSVEEIEILKSEYLEDVVAVFKKNFKSFKCEKGNYIYLLRPQRIKQAKAKKKPAGSKNLKIEGLHKYKQEIFKKEVRVVQKRHYPPM